MYALNQWGFREVRSREFDHPPWCAAMCVCLFWRSYWVPSPSTMLCSESEWLNLAAVGRTAATIHQHDRTWRSTRRRIFHVPTFEDLQFAQIKSKCISLAAKGSKTLVHLWALGTTGNLEVHSNYHIIIRVCVHAEQRISQLTAHAEPGTSWGAQEQVYPKLSTIVFAHHEDIQGSNGAEKWIK